MRREKGSLGQSTFHSSSGVVSKPSPELSLPHKHKQVQTGGEQRGTIKPKWKTLTHLGLKAFVPPLLNPDHHHTARHEEQQKSKYSTIHAQHQHQQQEAPAEGDAEAGSATMDPVRLFLRIHLSCIQLGRSLNIPPL